MLDNFPVVTMIPVADMDRAMAFYTETLGFEVVHPSENAPPALVAGKDTLFGPYPRPDHQPAAHTLAMWTVDDVEAVVDDLTERGVTFLQYDTPEIKTDDRGITVSGPMKGAWFKDTEGNILGIAQI